MPVLDQATAISYTGNGVTTVFAYPFKIFEDTDLQVEVDGVTQTLTTHYTVSGVGASGGGNVTFVTAPANAAAVVVSRAMPYVREIDFQDNGDLLAATLDEDNDRAVMLIQQLRQLFNRSLRGPSADVSVSEMPDAASRASLYLAFDANGDPVATAGTTSSIIVSSFIETLLDDANAAAARATIGAFASAGGNLSGMIVEAEGAAVASAASCNIWATDGNTCHITGTTQIDDFATAPQAGAWKKVIFDDALILNQSANLNINGGGADITTAAGDMAFVYADTTTQMDVFLIRKSGVSAVAPYDKVVQVVEATPIVTVVTCNTVIPIDDTIPQNTEGNEVITVTVTPTSATNRLRIEFSANGSASVDNQTTVALFQDTTAGALAASGAYMTTAGHMLSLSHEMAAGTTAATTFKIRVGPGSSTTYINAGSGGTRRYGGVSAARLRVTEIKV